LHDDLELLVGDIPAITKEYAKEIYNMSRYYYKPKRLLFKVTRNIFVAGVLASLLTFLLL